MARYRRPLSRLPRKEDFSLPYSFLYLCRHSLRPARARGSLRPTPPPPPCPVLSCDRVPHCCCCFGDVFSSATMRGRESVFVSGAGECEASEGQRPVHPGSEHGLGWGCSIPRRRRPRSLRLWCFGHCRLVCSAPLPPPGALCGPATVTCLWQTAAHAAPTIPRRDIGSGLGSVLPTVYLASSHEQA